MVNTLEEQVEERKQQARDRNIIGKIKIIAKGLGQPVKEESERGWTDGYLYRGDCSGELLVVSAIDYMVYPTRIHLGRRHLSTVVEYPRYQSMRFEAKDDEIESYIPGKWEKEIDRLVEEVLPPSLKKKLEMDAKLIKENKADKFGITFY